jgi:hypothetical protein
VAVAVPFRFSQSIRCRGPPRRSKTTEEAGRFDDESF